MWAQITESAVAVGAIAHAPCYGNARFDPPAAPRSAAPDIVSIAPISSGPIYGQGRKSRG